MDSDPSKMTLKLRHVVRVDGWGGNGKGSSSALGTEEVASKM